jgi:hypothetical protein
MKLKHKIGLALALLLTAAALSLGAGSHLTANILDLTTGFTLAGSSMISTTTGTGGMVLATSPTITSPTITGLTLSGTTAVSSLTIGGGSSLSTSNQTGTGNLVLATSPSLTSPTLSGPTFTGTAAGSVFTASTSLAIGGGTALTTTNQSGTGSIAMATSATLVTPVLTSPTISGATLTGVTNGALIKTQQTLQVVGANYTTTSTTLAAAGVITGLNFTGPVSLASYWSFHCDITYSQATAAAANLWGVITAGTAPSNLATSAEVFTSQTLGAGNAGVATGITGATATLVATSTPSAFGAIGTSADMFTAHLWGTLEAPANSTPSQVGIAVATGNASDALTVYRDASACWWF